MGAVQATDPFVRPYRSSDKEDALHVFRVTAAASLRESADPHVLHYASHIWCRPYVAMVPQHCYVVDDGNGKAVGYIIGTPKTADFVRQWQKLWIPQLQADEVHKPGEGEDIEWNENLANALRFICHSPEHMLKEEQPRLMADYPAHFHIDILPEFQRKGFGQKLIQTFCAEAKTHGANGVHLIMAGDNFAAGKFYEAMGFQRFPEVLDDGKSGELGRTTDNSVWYVKKL